MIFIVVVIGLLGLLKFIIKIREYDEIYDFGLDFLEHLNNFWESGGHDTQSYTWLINRSHKMQGQMGEFGIAHGYRAPYENHIINNGSRLAGITV